MNCTKRLVLPLGLMALMTFNACTPDDEAPFEEDNKTPAAYTYTAKINGKSWSGVQNLSLLVKSGPSNPAREMRISANSSDGKLLTLTLEDASIASGPEEISSKTYSQVIGGQSDASFLYVDTKTGSTYAGIYGTVNITKCDGSGKKLSGTFQCTLIQSQGDTLKVTGGILTDLPYDVTEQ